MDPKDALDRLGGYRVLRRIATGGTSDVLLAKAEGPLGFERQVVLKLLLSQYRDDQQFARMFAREAAAYARLSHPSIVRLFDFFSQNEQLVMVLEFVDGLPLNRLRAGLKDVGRKLTDLSSLYVADRVFDAIACAHGCIDENGAVAPVIHRDVNPSNVLVAWNGEVKLADFGIARVTGVRSETQSGLIKGTFGYMAPEQVNGGTIGPHTDVYAAGVLLWEMLAHRKAIQRGALPEIEILRAMAEPKIVSLDILRPDLDRRLREIVQATLEPDPTKRTVTAEQVVRALRDIAPAGAGRGELHELLKVAKDRDKKKKKLLSIPPAGGDSEPDIGAKVGILPAPAGVPRPGGAAAAASTQEDETEADAANETENENLDVDRLFDGLALPEEESALTAAVSASPTTRPHDSTGRAVDALLRTGEPPKSTKPPPPLTPEVGAKSAPQKTAPIATQPLARPSLEGLPTDGRVTVAVARPIDRKPESARAPKPESARPPPLPAAASKAAAKKPESHPPSPPQGLATTVLSAKPPSVAPPPLPNKGGTAPMPARAPSVGKIQTATPFASAATELAQEIAARFAEASAADTQTDATVARTAATEDRVPLPSGTTTLMMGSADTVRPPPGPLDRTLALPHDAVPPRAPPIAGEPPRAPPMAATPTPPPVPAFPHTPSRPIPVQGALAAGASSGSAPPAHGFGPLPSDRNTTTAPPPPAASRPPPAPAGSVVGKVVALVIVALLSAAGGVAYVQRARIMAVLGKGPPTTPTSTAPTASAPPVPEVDAAVTPAPTATDASTADTSTPADASALVTTSDAGVAADAGPKDAGKPNEIADSAAPSSGRTAKPNTTILNTAIAAPGHRIFVDGRAVAETPAAVEVGCGKHEIKLGSAGTPRTIDLPCGEEVSIGDR